METLSQNVKPETRKPRGENTMYTPPATVNPGEPQVKLDQFFEKMLSVFTKIVRPSAPKFSEDPLEYLRFNTALKVKVDKKKFYYAKEKRKSLLDAEEESVKSCLVKFMPGSDK